MGKKLFVGGLPWGVNDEDLKEAFVSFGDVRDAKVISDRETGRSRGFGFVTYATDDQAAKAIKAMDGSVMGNPPRTINVNEALERSGGGGGGGGGRPTSFGGGRRDDFGGGGGGGRRDDRGDDSRGRRGDRGR